MNQTDSWVLRWQRICTKAGFDAQCAEQQRMSIVARIYVAAVVTDGCARVVARELSRWESQDLVRFVCYFGAGDSGVAAESNVARITGALSVLFIFILFGVVELSLPEALSSVAPPR